MPPQDFDAAARRNSGARSTVHEPSENRVVRPVKAWRQDNGDQMSAELIDLLIERRRQKQAAAAERRMESSEAGQKKFAGVRSAAELSDEERRKFIASIQAAILSDDVVKTAPQMKKAPHKAVPILSRQTKMAALACFFALCAAGCGVALSYSAAQIPERLPKSAAAAGKPGARPVEATTAEQNEARGGAANEIFPVQNVTAIAVHAGAAAGDYPNAVSPFIPQFRTRSEIFRGSNAAVAAGSAASPSEQEQQIPAAPSTESHGVNRSDASVPAPPEGAKAQAASVHKKSQHGTRKSARLAQQDALGARR